MSSEASDLGAGQNKVMPAFGDNKNVMCYIDDIYVYLRARSVDEGREKPEKHEAKPLSAAEAEKACLGEGTSHKTHSIPGRHHCICTHYSGVFRRRHRGGANRRRGFD